MDASTHRRLNGVIEVVLLVLTGGLIAVLDVRLDHVSLPLLQKSALAFAGILDVVTAVDTPLTEHIEWFQLGGLANLSLGVALALGGLQLFGAGVGEAALAVGLLLGGILIAGLGVDMLVFRGTYTYGHSLTLQR